jgi:hypothetical protein
MATTVRTASGTWATVPMGDLGQPLNTFWQLFFRPNASTSWSDRVQATAVATNGGLVLAPGGRSLVVGVRPSNMLMFSPLISTADGGRSWSDGLITKGLVAQPEALATGPSGQPGSPSSSRTAVAVVSTTDGTDVLTTAGNLSAWQTLVTDRALSSGASGRACHPAAVTAVGYASATVVIGTSCTRPGTAGLFVKRGGGWSSVGPGLPGGLASARANVVGLVNAGRDLVALIELSGKAGPHLLVARTADGVTWDASQPLALGPEAHVTSFGAGPGTGVFVLISVRQASDELALGPDLGTNAWRWLPSPPPGTATVAFGPGPVVDALAVDRTVMTVWALASDGAAWREGQVVHVPIQFGSSS